ncbi:MAG: hypothetical protein Kow006_12110 [Gammaproteobacteria bacterium]
MKLRFLAVTMVAAALVAAPATAKNEKHQGLPPGLKKNVERGKPLPPGWQKKLAVGKPLEPQVYEASEVVVPVDRHGLLTIRVEGKLIRLFEATREIVEILE